MSEQEMALRIICLEQSIKKANYRIFLLEKNKIHQHETKKFIELHKKKDPLVQLDLFEAVGI